MPPLFLPPSLSKFSPFNFPSSIKLLTVALNLTQQMDSLMLSRQHLDLWPCTLATLATISLGKRVSHVNQVESGPAHLPVAWVRLLIKS